MDINSVNSSYSNYEATNTSSKKTTESDKAVKGGISEVAATYEPSSKNTDTTVKGLASKGDRSAIIEKLKADSEAKVAQMQSLVTAMFEKQGIKFATTDDMWKKLASGDFEADPETIAQAKEDISEDGYWGVNQTSDRIFDFALALSGGDEEKMKSMVSAIEKGFGEATKTWGKDLPDISSKTYDAVMSKVDKWYEEQGSETRTADILKG